MFPQFFIVYHFWSRINVIDTIQSVQCQDIAQEMIALEKLGEHIDVHPNGLAVNLCYGIMRARYRDGYDNPTLIEPGSPYEYTINMMPTGVRFGKGHRIRLDVSSSDFPNFDRNHNTGRDFWSDPELRVAHQTVFHDREHPSRLILPVIPL